MSCCSIVLVRLSVLQRADLDAAAAKVGLKSEDYAAQLILAALERDRSARIC